MLSCRSSAALKRAKARGPLARLGPALQSRSRVGYVFKGELGLA